MNSLIAYVEGILPTKKINIFGKDSLIGTSLPYYFFPLFVILGLALIQSHPWLLIVIIYAFVPLIDEIFSQDIRNPSEVERRQLQKNDGYFKAALYLQVILDWTLFFKVIQYFSKCELTFWNAINLIGLTFIFSNINAAQFLISHEIFHKPGIINRILGTLHMSKNLYMHFSYEHLYGHHRKVATPEDPASAAQGITVYEFFPRTFFGSYKSVYNMQKNEENKPFYLNYAVLSVVAAIAFTLAVYAFTNLQATILFLIEAFVSIFYLESINYIQHYGLRREKLPNGDYEKVTIRHSWNASHRFSNYLFFKLQRHSDHHENSLKPYQTLVSLDESPHLPHGYSLAIFLSFFPKIWFSIMDPLVEQYKKVKIGTIQNQVTLKAKSKVRKFGIKLGLAVTCLYAISFLILHFIQVT